MGESEHTSGHQEFSEDNDLRMVHPEHVNRGAANGRAAYQCASLEAKVISPFVASRVVEPCQLAGGRVASGEVWALVDIAVIAGNREVARDCEAPMLAGDDVVNLEWRLCTGLRQTPAVSHRPPARCRTRVSNAASMPIGA